MHAHQAQRRVGKGQDLRHVPHVQTVRGRNRRLRVCASQTQGATVLVGDIGGTNARLSLWRVDGPRDQAELFAKTYPTESHPTFDLVMGTFLYESQHSGPPPSAAALAVAGAVADNKCAMTNVNWLVDGNGLQEHYKFKVQLLNDFEAVGYGIPVLQDSDVVVLNKGVTVPKAPKIVMGPGTGLGAAQLMWDEGLQDYRVWPGEGSHATFAPRGWKQHALSMYAAGKLGGHCEIEQVACGSGLELIYEFLTSDESANRQGVTLGPAALIKSDGSPKTAADISAAALAGTDPLAVEAVDLLMAIVGAEAGAMALRCLAKGGAYIAGGITPKLLPRLTSVPGAGGALLEGFLCPKVREPFKSLLKTIPLSVITNDKVGQIGAREVAMKLLKN